MNAYGDRFRFTIWGQSHGPAIGVTRIAVPPDRPGPRPERRRIGPNSCPASWTA